MRKYSIDEIDRMRLLLRGRMGNGVDTQTDEAGLEARVRTYLTAGTDPDELSSALRSAIIAKWEGAIELIRQIKHDRIRKSREASAVLSLENKLRVYGMSAGTKPWAVGQVDSMSADEKGRRPRLVISEDDMDALCRYLDTVAVKQAYGRSVEYGGAFIYTHYANKGREFSQPLPASAA